MLTRSILTCVSPQVKNGYMWRVNHSGKGNPADSGCRIIPNVMTVTKNNITSQLPVTIKSPVKLPVTIYNLANNDSVVIKSSKNTSDNDIIPASKFTSPVKTNANPNLSKLKMNYGDCSHTVFTKQISNGEVHKQHKRAETSKSSAEIIRGSKITEIAKQISTAEFVTQGSSIRMINQGSSDEFVKQGIIKVDKKRINANFTTLWVSEVAKQNNSAEIENQSCRAENIVHGSSFRMVYQGSTADVHKQCSIAEVAKHCSNAEVKKPSGSDELTEQSSSAELAKQSSSAELAKQSSSAELATKGSSAELTEHSSSAELATKSSSAELTEQSSSAELATKSSSVELTEHSSSAELAKQSSSAEIATKSSSAELAKQSSSREIATKSSSAELAKQNGSAKIATKSSSAEDSELDNSTEVSKKGNSAEQKSSIQTFDEHLKIGFKIKNEIISPIKESDHNTSFNNFNNCDRYNGDIIIKEELVDDIERQLCDEIVQEYVTDNNISESQNKFNKEEIMELKRKRDIFEDQIIEPKRRKGGIYDDINDIIDISDVKFEDEIKVEEYFSVHDNKFYKINKFNPSLNPFDDKNIPGLKKNFGSANNLKPYDPNAGDNIRPQEHIYEYEGYDEDPLDGHTSKYNQPDESPPPLLKSKNSKVMAVPSNRNSEIIREEDDMVDFFLKNGLESDKWRPIFIAAGILSFSDISSIKDDKNKYDQIILHANMEEKDIFSNLFHMVDNPASLSQAELSLEVIRIGLDDSNYWIPILNKYFGVRSKLGLQFLGPDSYLTINQFSRNVNETEIIKKICNVPLGNDFDEWQENIMQKNYIRLKELKLLFNDMVKIEESKIVSNDLFEQILDKYIELMQQNELNFDKDLSKGDIFYVIFEEIKTTIEYMEEYKIESRVNTNETNIKQLVSQCLGGILISDSLSDQCKQRECILKVPGDIKLQPSIIPEITETNISFTSEDELSFKSCLETLGYSITTLIESKGFYGCHSNKELLKQSEEKNYPALATDYNIVPVASYVFDVKTLYLCSDAISELKAFEELLLQPKPSAAAIQKSCEDFLNVYGSHVNFGRIHFGGMFMSCRKSKENKNNYEGRRYIFQNEFINLNDVTNEFRNNTGISSKEKGTPTKVTVIGGSEKELFLSPWRHSVKSNKKFWRVVDRGCNLIPVWEVLKLNHDTEFKDVNLISDCLSQGWERLVKIDSNIPLFIEKREIEKEVQIILGQLQSWVSEEDHLSSCETNLCLLLHFKEDLHFKTKDPLAFARMILTHASMHKYIKILNLLTEKSTSEEVRHINVLMKHIVSDSCYVGVDFCMKISNEFSSSPNVLVLQNFEAYLNKLLVEFQMQLQTETSDVIPISMKGMINTVQNLSCTLKYTFSELTRYHHTYGELLLLMILMPLDYSHHCKLFHNWYHDKAIQHILDNIKHFDKLSSYKNEVEIQAFILHLGLSIADPQYENKNLTCVAFKNYLQDRLNSNISELLEYYDDYEKLNTELSNIFLGVSYRDMFGEKYLEVQNDGEKSFILELNCVEPNDVALDVQDTNQLKQGNEKSLRILKDLCLEEVLSYNFGMREILTITRSSLKFEEPQTLKEKILNIISKQVMLDYRSRNIQLCITSNHIAERNLSKQSDNKRIRLDTSENEIAMDIEDHDEFESMLLELTEESQQKNTNQLHPLDVSVIIMNCADNILRQIIVQKMTICQLAIPLVLPNLLSSEPVFLLWALRLINMKWKTQSNDAQDINAVDYPTPIVSAIRLGELSKSKSKILNDILCNQPHDIFFHRDCEAGNFQRKISDGVIELAWYLPGGKKEDNFDNLMALANLRGDAMQHSKQFELLSKISSVMLVCLTTQSISNNECSLMLKKLSTSNHQLVFIFLDTVSNISHENQIQALIDFKKLMDIKRFKTVLGSVKGQVKNAALLTAELRRQINLSLRINLETADIKEKLNWEKVSDIARCIGIKVDEDSKSCQHGKNMANIIIKEIKSKQITTIKEQILPLQGQLWSEWSRLSKEQARMDGILGKDQETYISDLHIKKRECRKKQFYLVDKMSSVMKKFIQNLIQTKDNPEIRISFMQWMKLGLDGISHKELPELQMMYHSLWNDIQEQRIKQLNDTVIMGTQNQLDEVERNLIATSYGLEHFMREVGQVYEATVDQNTSDKFSSLYLLPQFAADLLISGFPLEIMDGDVSHMPLTWVSAVFDRLKLVLGDKKLYVISVLGVQSSGKSTLLNTMFGLNFAVSAGRYTKGVYAQLIPVDNHLNDELGYDYILVLDTEGLRAPEIGKTKLSHDNELAALVIGMGDVTILNIKGENTAEIEDILQISVHAFLRMRLIHKSLKLQPGCYFVHQNVPAVNASEKMLYGYKKLQEQLDIITIAAAEQEHATGIQSFRDVIEFDMKNVWYFSSLWQGDPPMAPANPCYSEKVLELKINLLKYPSHKRINCLTFDDVNHRMSDLWNAIKYENFVFSFKNSLEVKSYNYLEEKFSLLSWKFRNDVKKWINGSINEILSCDEKNISSLHGTITSSLHKCIENIFSKCKNELDDFFSSARDKDILVQWKSNTEIKLQSLSDELKSEALKTCNIHFEMRKAQFVQEKRIESYQKQLMVFVKELVSTKVEEKLSDESLNKMFNEKWNEWIEMLHLEQIEQEKDIVGDVLTILARFFKKNSRLIQMEIGKSETIEMEECNLDNSPYIDKEDFNPKSSYFKKMKYYTQILFDGSGPMIEIQNFTCKILHRFKTYLNEKKCQDYDQTFIWDICNSLNENLDNFNSGGQPYALTINYRIKITVYILRNAIPFFKKMHGEYRKKNDLQYFLEENFKPQLQKLFRGSYSQCLQEKTAAEVLSTSLEKPILSSLNREIPRKIAENFTSSHSDFHTKLRLHAKVMENLGNERNFEKYIQFIKTPNISMENWLEVYVSDYCIIMNANGNTNLVNSANEILRNTVLALVNCVKEASVNTNDISFKTWLRRYHYIAKRIIPISDSLFNILDSQQVKNIEYFEEMFILGLRNIQTNLEQQLSTWTMKDFDILNERPHLLIAKNILGCTAQCPFCKQICTHTIAGHDSSHSSPQHAPQAIGGFRYMKTNIMILNSCNVNVAGNGTFKCRDHSCKCWDYDENFDNTDQYHKFKEYHKAGTDYASWNISPDTSLGCSKYWKWVLCQFSTQFAQYYHAIAPVIPFAWYTITWEEARKSIRKSCGIH